jgi:hypothetical protein
MNRLHSTFLLLAAMAFPVVARAQEPAASSKPKEIVVVGSKLLELRKPTRAVLLEPQKIDAAGGGKATLEVSDATLAKVLKRAYEEKEGLGDLELRAPGEGGGQNYLVWELKNVRVTSYSINASGLSTARISWMVGGVEHEDSWDAQTAAPARTGREAASTQSGDALTAARFSITVDGYEIASFSEIVDLNARANPPTVVLKRGKNSSMDMWSWHEAARSGHMAAGRKSATLVMYDYDGKPVARYHLVNAWPSKIETGGLESGTGKVAVETLELAHEGFLEMVTIVAEKIERVSP